MPVSAANAYYLSLCLLYPQPDRKGQLVASAAALDAPWATEMAATFAGESLQALQIEHTRLFVNTAGGVPCPPYEAAYVDGHLMTATTAAVAATYAEWGLEHSQEVADYLPVELQFVAYLAELAAQAQGDEVRREIEKALRTFKVKHLQPWLARFAQDLQEHARLAFYRQVGSRLAALAEEIEDGN